jgi:hypothetical protein
MSRRPESERSDWTDLDLLTVDQAAVRVHDEIVETEQQLAGLDPDAAAERELVETRLRALRRLADRYGPPPR